MKVIKSEIVTAMKACMNGIEKGKSSLKGSDVFTFENGIMYSFNNDVAVSVPIPYPDLDGSIKAEEAFKLFSKLSHNEIEIEVKRAHWEVIAGNTKIKLKKIEDDCLDYISSLNIEDGPMHQISPDFHKALAMCTLTKNKSTHSGVAFNGDYAMSTDAARMSFYKLTAPMPKFWLGEDACKFLASTSEIDSYRIDSAWAHFKLSDGTYYSARRISHTIYPFTELMEVFDYFSDIGKQETTKHCTFPLGVKEAIEKVSILSESMGTTPLIDLHFTNDKLELSGISDAGAIQVTLMLTEPFEEDFNVVTTMTADFLKEAVAKSCSFYIAMNGRNHVIVVEGDKFTQLTNAIVR